MKTEMITLNAERNVTLSVCLLDVGGEFGNIPKRPLVLVLPGGGYYFCSDREADPVAAVYQKAGYHTAILRYSVQKDAEWPNPLTDYEQAMACIREHADEWGVYADKIAVIGFSAGGHLAAAAAVMSNNRPNAAILGYAVVGEDVKGCNPSAPDTISRVDENTPPCFVFATRTDDVVPINNSLRFLMALDQYGIAFESHIYGYGPHGFSTGDYSVQQKETVISPSVPEWTNDSVVWLRAVFGEFGTDGLEEPVCPAKVSKQTLL